MLGFLKEKIKKVYNSFTTKVSSIFSRASLDEEFIKELNDLLLAADTGIKATTKIIQNLQKQIANKTIGSLEQAKQELEHYLTSVLKVEKTETLNPTVLLLVGVNGTGKTTFAAKLAALLKAQGKRVLLVAGDTFRAAATQQLAEWGRRADVEVFVGRDSQDPASVIFDACKMFSEEGFDHLIIDTAGRLQTKVNLMRELEKIRRIIDKQLDGYQISTWLAVDSMLGQNSLRQAELFYESTQITGVVLTKFDGSGKGGIVFAIADQLQVPIQYVTFGEALEDVKVFDAAQYVEELLNE
jgi:fused signal recognition particle receptor